MCDSVHFTMDDVEIDLNPFSNNAISTIRSVCVASVDFRLKWIPMWWRNVFEQQMAATMLHQNWNQAPKNSKAQMWCLLLGCHLCEIACYFPRAFEKWFIQIQFNSLWWYWIWKHAICLTCFENFLNCEWNIDKDQWFVRLIINHSISINIPTKIRLSKNDLKPEEQSQIDYGNFGLTESNFCGKIKLKRILAFNGINMRYM